jgi:hypothetical protein
MVPAARSAGKKALIEVQYSGLARLATSCHRTHLWTSALTDAKTTIRH